MSAQMLRAAYAMPPQRYDVMKFQNADLPNEVNCGVCSQTLDIGNMRTRVMRASTRQFQYLYAENDNQYELQSTTKTRARTWQIRAPVNLGLLCSGSIDMTVCGQDAE